MTRWIGGCCFAALALLLAPASASGPDPAATARGSASPLEAKPGKVMCSYLHYGQTKFVCGPPPVAEIKKKCNEKATKDRGEKTECACTDDPNYIQDVCD